MRVDISLDAKATHYCKWCGLTMKAKDHFMCPQRDGDFCEPRKREGSSEPVQVVAERLYIAYLRARGGPKMPWSELGERAKRGWRAVAQEAIKGDCT